MKNLNKKKMKKNKVSACEVLQHSSAWEIKCRKEISSEFRRF